MANKKLEYEDNEVYRKNIDLTGKTIKALERMAKLETRELKPFIEVKLNEIAEKSIKQKNKSSLKK